MGFFRKLSELPTHELRTLAQLCGGASVLVVFAIVLSGAFPFVGNSAAAAVPLWHSQVGNYGGYPSPSSCNITSNGGAECYAQGYRGPGADCYPSAKIAVISASDADGGQSKYVWADGSVSSVGSAPIVASGQAVTLDWACQPSQYINYAYWSGGCYNAGSANYVFANTSTITGPGVSNTTGNIGQMTVYPSGSPGTIVNYNLTCSGPGGTWNTSVPVQVTTAGMALSATPPSVNLGGGTTLNWSTTNTTPNTCMLQDQSGAILYRAGFGSDSSGDNNAWTVSNIQSTDQVVDTPTNSYATGNPIDKDAEITLAEGNLKGTGVTTSWGNTRSTIAVSSGKWYAEYTMSAVSENGAGIATNAAVYTNLLGTSAGAVSYYRDGTKWHNGSNAAYGTSYTSGDVIGAALDADAGTVTFYKNNVSQGALTLGFNPPYFFGFSLYTTSSTGSLNFGQGGQSGLTYNSAAGGYFKYTPPAGYKALSTANLPAPTIDTPTNYFASKAYIANETAQSFTSDGVFTVPSNYSTLTVTVNAGGGGGGGNGGCCDNSPSGVSGSPGGASSFGSVIANGGGGGQGGQGYGYGGLSSSGAHGTPGGGSGGDTVTSGGGASGGSGGTVSGWSYGWTNRGFGGNGGAGGRVVKTYSAGTLSGTIPVVIGTGGAAGGNGFTNWNDGVPAAGSAGSVSITWDFSVTGYSLTGLNFQPDLVWIKNRLTTNWHVWADSVRGATKSLFSNSSGVETTNDSNGYVTAFSASGFDTTLGSNVGALGSSYGSWSWKESPTAGFDIVSYAGDGTTNRSVAHNLGVTPEFIIVKDRSTAGDWYVWHKDLLGYVHNLYFNRNTAQDSSNSPWLGDYLPTMTSGTVGDVTITSGSGNAGYLAADNNTGTFWDGGNGAFPKYLTVDLGSTKSVGIYSVRRRQDIGNSAPEDWKLQGSANGSSWVDVDTQTGQSFDSVQQKTYTLSSVASYRYYRLNVSRSRAGNAGVDIGEIELFPAPPNSSSFSVTSNATNNANKGTVPTTLYLTSGSSWAVPADWNSVNNIVEVIGGGGGGGSASGYGGAGGGGAYSKKTNVSLTPGGSATYAVGAGGSTSGTAGGDTYFNGASCAGASVCAKGGSGGVVGDVAAPGGAASGGVGDVKYSGGNSGAGGASGWGASGAGGAAGPGGAGTNGGNANHAGGGGGASQGGSAGSDGNGLNQAGGAGGNNSSGSGGGAGGGGGDGGAGSGSAGSSGGGGGGGGSAANGWGGYGGNGSNGTDWDSTHGSGSGGGGSGRSAYSGRTGGAGGLYGGGGGGATYPNSTGAGGSGGQGIIRITYTPSTATPSDYIAYLWASKPGLSKIGSYAGNNSTEGPFIYTGFKPALVIIKSSTAAYGWYAFDNKRKGYNPATCALFPDTARDEDCAGPGGNNNVLGDMLSNGFKIRSTGGGFNTSGSTDVYAAFAEMPFKYTGEAAGTYSIQNSIRLNQSSSSGLGRTVAATGSRTTFTYSLWVKNSDVNATNVLLSWTTAGSPTKDEFVNLWDSSGVGYIYSRTGSTNYYAGTASTNRDPAAWRHMVYVVDTTQPVASDRFRIYINGVRQTMSSVAYPPQNYTLPYANVAGSNAYIGKWYDNPWRYADTYLADVHFIDGLALDASYFASSTPHGGWGPMQYSGNYGTNGFHLLFNNTDDGNVVGTLDVTNITSPQTYTLTCGAPEGGTVSVPTTVTIRPPTMSVSACDSNDANCKKNQDNPPVEDPYIIKQGTGTAYLKWSALSVTANSCTVTSPVSGGITQTVYLTSGNSWTVPSDWTSSNNSIEVIGGGGGGGGGANTNSGAGGGGGGGAYSKITNLSLTAGANVAYAVGTAGTAGGVNASGGTGGDTWFNGASLAGSSVGAKGGTGGIPNSTGGAGGALGSGVGTTKYSGGNGGGVAGAGGGGGGGGAGSPNGNGQNGGHGVNAAAGPGGGGGSGGGSGGETASPGVDGRGGNNSSGSGGGASGGGGVGGAGSASAGNGGGGGGGGSAGGGAGGSGKEWDATHGSGGGAGGTGGAAGVIAGATGGNYGGGGGGGGFVTGSTGGAGGAGIIVIRYTAFSSTVPPSNTNSYTGAAVSPTASTTYTLTCEAPFMTPSAQASTTRVAVIPNACSNNNGTSCNWECSIGSNAQYLLPGSNPTISWCCPAGISDTGATVNGASKPMSGTMSGTNGTYTLVCNPSGITGDLTISNINPYAVNAYAVPQRIRSGQTTRVFWNDLQDGVHTLAALPESACTLKDGSGATVATGKNSPAEGYLTPPLSERTTYTIMCTDGAGGSVSNRTTINFLPGYREF